MTKVREVIYVIEFITKTKLKINKYLVNQNKFNSF